MGIIVDRVAEVTTINEADIEPAPDFGARLRSEYIKGMAKCWNKVLIILDIELILTDEELTFGPKAAAGTSGEDAGEAGEAEDGR
jgi:purine-binding chemotaxis protein CheW